MRKVIAQVMLSVHLSLDEQQQYFLVYGRPYGMLHPLLLGHDSLKFLLRLRALWLRLDALLRPFAFATGPFIRVISTSKRSWSPGRTG